jgi:DNA-binding NtrC family response regulator
MRRILFVDDDTNVLEGLRDSLRERRGEWDMIFAHGGEEALANLAALRFDVVVCDMRMPGVNGVDFLRHVRERHPEIVRIVLSGHGEYAESLRSATFAHQFLSKPCSADELYEVVERTASLRARLARGKGA